MIRVRCRRRRDPACANSPDRSAGCCSGRPSLRLCTLRTTGWRSRSGGTTTAAPAITPSIDTATTNRRNMKPPLMMIAQLIGFPPRPSKDTNGCSADHKIASVDLQNPRRCAAVQCGFDRVPRSQRRGRRGCQRPGRLGGLTRLQGLLKVIAREWPFGFRPVALTLNSRPCGDVDAGRRRRLSGPIARVYQIRDGRR
jgi:hypothetical protein